MDSNRKKRRRRIWPVVLLLIAAVAAVRLFSDYFAETFTIHSVTVEGNSVVEEEEILKLSGIRPGTNLFSVPASRVESRVDGHWLIREALVIRQIPDQVIIRVTERRPLLILSSGDRFAVVDQDGICIELVRKLSDRALPYYSGRNLDTPLTLGQKIVEEEVLRVIRFTGEIPEHLRYLAREIEPGIRTWTIYSVNGIKVKLGLGENTEDKLYLLESIFNETAILENSGDVSYLDLSDPERPVIKYEY